MTTRHQAQLIDLQIWELLFEAALPLAWDRLQLTCEYDPGARVYIVSVVVDGRITLTETIDETRMAMHSCESALAGARLVQRLHNLHP